MQNNEEYWIKRAENRILNSEKTANEMLKDMKKLYQDTINKINKEIEAFIGRYSEKQGLTVEDTRKLLTNDELNRFRKEAIEYYNDLSKHVYDPAYRNKLKSQIYSATTKEGRLLYSLRRNISRLDYLKMQMQFYIENMYMKQNEAFTKNLSKTYEEIYMRSMYDSQKAVGVYSSFNSLNSSIINKAVQERWLGDNYSDRIWRDKNSLVATLETTFSQDVAMGKNPKEIARDISKKMNVKYSNCERLARTEFNHIANQATMDSYEATDGLDRYKYVATLDSRTSEICQNLDGKVFLLKEAEEGVNYPSMHPNCRSTTIPYFEDEDITERIAKLPSGDVVYIPSSMNYKEWLSSLTEKDQKMYFSKRKAEQQKASDKKQFAEYKKLVTRLNKTDKKDLLEGLPTKFEEFRRLKYLNQDKYEIYKSNAKIARSYLRD